MFPETGKREVYFGFHLVIGQVKPVDHRLAALWRTASSLDSALNRIESLLREIRVVVTHLSIHGLRLCGQLREVRPKRHSLNCSRL